MKHNRYIITTLTTFGWEHWTVRANSKARAMSDFVREQALPRRCIKNIKEA